MSVPKAVRHLVVAPLVVVLEVVFLALTPLLALVAVVLTPLAAGSRALRAVAIAGGFAARHLAATLACAGLWVASGFGRTIGSSRMQRAHYALMRWFASGVYGSMTRWARVDVRVSEAGDAREALTSRERPLIALSRHAGEGDSLLVLHELLCRHRRRARVVLHEALRLDPLVNALGHRLPNRFVDPRGGDTEVEIAAMARDVGEGDAVLIFPEGGNFSPARRRRGIARLEQAGHDEEAAWARAMQYVTAPRPGGTLAALEAAPHADVLFVGHVGVPAGVPELWRRLGGPSTVEVRLWLVRAEDVPHGRDERIDWLFGWWRTLDAWIAEREPGASPAPAAGRQLGMTADDNDAPASPSEGDAREADAMQRRVDELGEHIDEAVKKAQVTRDQARPEADETLADHVGDWSDTASSDDDPSGAVGEAGDTGR